MLIHLSTSRSAIVCHCLLQGPGWTINSLRASFVPSTIGWAVEKFQSSLSKCFGRRTTSMSTSFIMWQRATKFNCLSAINRPLALSGHLSGISVVYTPLTQHCEWKAHLTVCGWVNFSWGFCNSCSLLLLTAEQKLTSYPVETFFFLAVAQIWLHNQQQVQDNELYSGSLPSQIWIPLWIFFLTPSHHPVMTAAPLVQTATSFFHFKFCLVSR